MSDKKGPRILLVDDDSDMCESLSDVLTMDSDYDVSHTTDPLNAIEIVREEDFALIVCDFKMPNMNGVELLTRIKEIKPDAMVFLLTAFISNELIEQAEKAGAAKVLSKFIWPDEILRHIKETIGG
jgi:two-component system, NtrC family, response regulator HydG